MEATLIGGRVAVANGSAHDFADWVEPHLPAMTRFAGRLVPSADRDDLVQDALVRAWRRWPTYDTDRGAPLPWLLAILADQGRRTRVRARPRALPLSDDGSLVDLTPADLDLERAISGLSARQRMAVDLYYFVDLDIAAVAAVMDCAPGTVKATLSQARARLRELVGDNDD
ncbi:MAG: sigma-70 family RNA polymerase sigma factor [Propionibacteriales bacterium]|nr:sigma-70 family RNA polymerase sigma factor [Propionibacteriales bacterium]